MELKSMFAGQVRRLFRKYLFSKTVKQSQRILGNKLRGDQYAHKQLKSQIRKAFFLSQQKETVEIKYFSLCFEGHLTSYEQPTHLEAMKQPPHLDLERQGFLLPLCLWDRLLCRLGQFSM